MDPATCPKADSCGNYDVRCDLCVGFSFYVSGKNRGKGMRHEKAIVNSINKAKQRRGSGASAYAKGDVIDDLALHEGKSGYASKTARGTKSFTIQRSWLLKLRKEALAEGLLPLLQIKFDGAPDDEIWTVIDSDILQDLLQELVELRKAKE